VSRARDGGAALLAVLWFVAAVSALAVTFLRLATGDRFLIVTQISATQARALAEEGLGRTLILLNNRADKPLPKLISWQLPDGQIDARVEGETGRIDLNASDKQLIARLARVVGVPADKADAIGDAVQDWRDPDDLRQPKGAERQDYAAADRGYGPANRPFRSVEELRYVLPVDADAYTRMAPYLTVYSGRPTPDPRLAPPPVVAAVGAKSSQKPQDATPGPDSDSAQGQQPSFGGNSLASGDSPPPGGGPSRTPQPAGAGVSVQAGTVYRISLDVKLAGGYESHARAVVALAGDPGSNLVRVLDWGTALPPGP
jgi:general secretion pathway protein K